MEKSAENKKGNKIRNIGMVLGGIGFAIVIILLVTSAANTYPAASILAVALIFISLPLMLVGEKVYNADYYLHDFGEFTTQISDIFEADWKQIAPDEELSAFNCKIKEFQNERKGGDGRVLVEQTIRYKKYEKVPLTTFFKIIYMEFESENERASNENKIVELYENKMGSIRHYSEGNVHIILQAYITGFSVRKQSTYTFSSADVNSRTVGIGGITKTALKNIELK